MPQLLPDADLDRAAAVLGVAPERDGALTRLALSDPASGRRLAVEVTRTDTGAIVKVYGTEAHLELHDCAGLVTSDELGEVIFFARGGGRVAGLVIEREAACSLYANVAERLLSADFLTVAPEVAQAAVVLSLSEPLFEGDWSPENEA
ncbi:hypothetical protein B1759_07615 [Rubrivirga sp. SAORIC476]|uniref:hypothetical protein n=1 Tax=Rubrivirga sp. SAORIC476 TaxID=1961794 RepID=UPI000BA939DA|nr:hypothetical protein [Rubrivirga sp. SAORIC476]MAQ93225.1 hypothetical protein [Rhodothermaceae bacterium]MBC14478.1 hypothetical protein [Rhodothermaceae bacterium]PAP81196.1 hypothetical protein B1759_07615 [Rubrivirga sp. SAORIC476]